MAHQYSVEIHKFITERLQETEELLKQPEASREKGGTRRLEGIRDELIFFRNLLTEKYDLSNRKYY